MAYQKICSLVPGLEQDVKALFVVYCGGGEPLPATHAEVVSAITRFLASVITILNRPVVITAVPELTDPESTVGKEAALMLYDEFYEAFVSKLEIPFLPGLVGSTYADQRARAAMRNGVSGLYDGLVRVIGRYTWLAAAPTCSSVFQPF